MERIKISLVIHFSKRDIARIVYIAVNPENMLAPEKISLKHLLENSTIKIEVEGDIGRHADLKISTIKRTVDDYIWSLAVAYNTVIKMEKKNENKSLLESG